jgi:Protein of unknown function (DUF1559)/Domain of unknown function (DUF4190)
MIQFTCPCGKALHARDDYAGETTACPDCGREVVIPGGEGRLTADAPRGARRPPDDAVQRSRPGRPDERDRDDRPRPPTTSGMAVSSAIFGVLSLVPCSVLAGLPAILLGVFALLAIGRSRGSKRGKGLAITGIVTGVLSVLLLPVLLSYSVYRVREAAARITSSNNLKQITLSMHDYNSATGTLPPAAICDASGKPLLSWRVAIVPYIEGGNLYSQFKLDEAWDGPNNSKLLLQMPKIYALPGDTEAAPGYTYYRVFVGKGAAFDPPRPGNPPFGLTPGARMPADFTDGTSNTILVVEAATAVPWTKPDDLLYDPQGPLPPLGGHWSGGSQVGMADGSVRMVPSTVSQATLRAAITRAGGEILGPDW